MYVGEKNSELYNNENRFSKTVSVDYSGFIELFGKHPEDCLLDNFSEEELLDLMRLDYIDMDYGDFWEDFTAESDKQDLVDELIAEGFDENTLMKAVREILAKRRNGM